MISVRLLTEVMPRFAARAGLLWHPQQRLWNWRLASALRRRIRPRRLGALAVGMVVAADTSLLVWRVLVRRARLLGVSALLDRQRLPDRVPVVYLDLGTHASPTELIFSRALVGRLCRDFTVFGFEANLASCRAAQEAVAGLDRVRILHLAACDEVPETGFVTLYSHASPNDRGLQGQRDSIHRRTAAGEQVPAVRLSSWLQDEGLAGGDRVLVLRMNIEGAEFDVLRDLVAANLAGLVDGYYGLWDDLSKFDTGRDREFRAFASRHGVRSLTFNRRDMHWPSRRRLIAYDLGTSLYAGARRVERAEAGRLE